MFDILRQVPSGPKLLNTRDHYNCRLETWLPGGVCQKERVKYSINRTEYTIEGVSGGAFCVSSVLYIRKTNSS